MPPRIRHRRRLGTGVEARHHMPGAMRPGIICHVSIPRQLISGLVHRGRACGFITTASTDEATAVGVQEAILSQLLP